MQRSVLHHQWVSNIGLTITWSSLSCFSHACSLALSAKQVISLPSIEAFIEATAASTDKADRLLHAATHTNIVYLSAGISIYDLIKKYLRNFWKKKRWCSAAEYRNFVSKANPVCTQHMLKKSLFQMSMSGELSSDSESLHLKLLLAVNVLAFDTSRS